MIWLYIIIGGFAFLILVLGLFAFGFWHLRRSIEQAIKQVKQVRIADIPELADECVRVFDERLALKLDLDDVKASADSLAAAFRRRFGLKHAFRQSGFYWNFVKPVGAFVGELIRNHADAEWEENADRAPSLVINMPDGEVKTLPFERVIRQGAVGDPRYFHAYVLAATQFVEDAPPEPKS